MKTGEAIQYDGGNYDVIVVGAGHAGSEAALAAARMGNKTLLITISLEMVAFMPCNPSLGGPAKGIVVREIDALGGEMGHNIDKTYIQMRMLNTGKGPAVRALRAQADKHAYHRQMKLTLEKEPNLTLRQGTVDDLIVEDGVCKGVITNTGAKYGAKTVVLTVGTAARGKIIIGELQYESGPNNSKSATKLSECLERLGFDLERFKTGTPPRINGNTIHYDETEEQPGDKEPNHFSFDTPDSQYLALSDQISCWLTYTNPHTHDLIRANLDRAPMFSGVIKGVGPRYCPSIEDKIVRFADKDRHQLFLEPEGRDTDEYYVDGLSTSMPEEIQQKMLHSVKGLEDAELMRPGYAIEYDFFDPTQLYHTMESKVVKNLYFAGQVNGTTGYEEASGQGMMAGISAHIRCHGGKDFIIGRDEAYIGVLIDDLVTKGVDEPYRMFTSRAEYRILLRMDDADMRLTPKAWELGLASKERYSLFIQKREQIEDLIEFVKSYSVKPKYLNGALESLGTTPLKHGCKLVDLITRPQVTLDNISPFIPDLKERMERISDRKEEIIEAAEIRMKYQGYIERERMIADKLVRLENIKIRGKFNYDKVHSLSTEAREKLKKIDPENIAQASRIPGVSPSDVNVLLVLAQK